MKPLSYLRVLTAGILLCTAAEALAQEDVQSVESPYATTHARSAYTTTNNLNDVRAFQGWYADACFTEGVDLEPLLSWGDYDHANFLRGGARVAAWMNPELEIGGELGVVSYDPDRGDGDMGVSDLTLYSRYELQPSNPRIAVGTFLDLPFGNDNAGQGTFDITIFGAMRYMLSNGMAILGNAGLQSLDTGDRENGLMLGGGMIIPMTEELALISELKIGTANEYIVLSGGLDYELPPGGHFRSALALGLDDGAPDIQLELSLAIPLW